MNDRSSSLVFVSIAGAAAMALLSGACRAPEVLGPPPDDVALRMGAVEMIGVQALADQQSYDPCDGKVCGEICHLCPPEAGDTCAERIYHCNAAGICAQTPPACTSDDAP